MNQSVSQAFGRVEAQTHVICHALGNKSPKWKLNQAHARFEGVSTEHHRFTSDYIQASHNMFLRLVSMSNRISEVINLPN